MNKDSLTKYINERTTIREIAKLFDTTIHKVRYQMKKYNLSSLNKPSIVLINNDKCYFCYKPTSNNKMYCSTNCKTRQHLKINSKEINKNKNDLRKNFKQLAVDYKGGKCSICGYKKNLASLSFHHLNPAEKDINISKYKASKILKSDHLAELNKCILLCENCHQEEHFRLNSLILNPSKQTIKAKIIRLKLIEYKGGKCVICDYNKCQSSLSFHHVNPQLKEFNIDNRTCNGYSYDRLIKEANKCLLLCQNCHQEEHHPTLINLDR